MILGMQFARLKPALCLPAMDCVSAVSWPFFRRSLGVAAAVSSMAITGGCSREAVLRYRVTVEMEAAGKVYTGSSVMELRTGKPSMALATPYDGSFSGEAIVVELPGDKKLFALLKSADGGEARMASLPDRLFADLRPEGGDRVKWARAIAARQEESRELTCPDEKARRGLPAVCPMFVTFDDLKDPSTLQIVDPERAEVLLGEGVYLRRLIVTVTRDNVTNDIKGVLPWLEAVGRQRGSLAPNPHIYAKDATLAQRVTPFDFTTELYR